MNIELSLSLLDDVYEKLPSINIPQEVFDFINLMKSAKYSTFLNEEKEENLAKITDLQQFIINLDNQINSNLSNNLTYEQQKVSSANQITELENDNSIIDEMIVDHS